ncbi:origin of replication complex subunit 6 isoform X2 [Phalaenopsis equestris]|uniref:origin of replication complex subunit 6 isoform X2 n=1 Tax=Phalaenopsis equestris TaxID=78828 RepID=UPI0009E24D92|nr:origin of replication complex subunit 6 isoform X2 [Phalaenopsis equestris]
MDISSIAARLGHPNSKTLIRKAEEIRRLSDVQFDSSIMGVGEVVKAIVCVEIAASRLQMIFDRSAAIRLSGMSEKAYIRCFNAMQNGIGVKASLDVRELAIQFGCVRLISFVQKGLSLYRERFLAALPASRRANTDFSRPVFTAVAFYLCAKKHKLKVDRFKLIELSGTSESEFLTILNSMNDLCFDVIGISKEKKDVRAVKGHRELLETLPSKMMRQDDSDVSDDSSIDVENDIELPCYKKRKLMEKKEYNEWKSSVISSNQKIKKAPAKRSRQTQLNFPGKLQQEFQ